MAGVQNRVSCPVCSAALGAMCFEPVDVGLLTVLFLPLLGPLARDECPLFFRRWGGSGNSTSNILPIGCPAFAGMTGWVPRHVLR